MGFTVSAINCAYLSPVPIAFQTGGVNSAVLSELLSISTTMYALQPLR